MEKQHQQDKVPRLTQYVLRLNLLRPPAGGLQEDVLGDRSASLPLLRP